MTDNRVFVIRISYYRAAFIKRRHRTELQPGGTELQKHSCSAKIADP